ncbi:MAG TPA: hypothetical protein PK869_14355 [Candidatus Hydrogenedentes bacterium]|nr:hypothetical protein [Candidatus Hydrogenedentota bacterium]
MVRQRACFAGFLLLFLALAAPAFAEVKVSVTITGTIEELIPVLQKLQELGIGGAPAVDDPLKLNVHSVMTEAGAPADAPAPLAIGPVTVEPAAAKAGDSVLISAAVQDQGRAVDTVAAAIGELRIDLFDNGTEGDLTAGDGIWSRQIALPATLAAGDAPVSVSAYNASGEAVTVPDATGNPVPLTAEGKVSIATP